jgi:hypothetical protein
LQWAVVAVVAVPSAPKGLAVAAVQVDMLLHSLLCHLVNPLVLSLAEVAVVVVDITMAVTVVTPQSVVPELLLPAF